MAQKITTLLIDDLDGGEAHESTTFGLDGKTYEIDLSEVHIDELRALLAPYMKAGRRAGGRAAAGTRGGSTAKSVRAAGEPTPEEYRKWAADHGHKVSTRGRISAPIKQAYAAANA
ncbi:Lsr2 family protein [Streptomyces sp. 21So2-11]|uniref:histone-like nucleoid-structuring protein Lsr2 n=1 Tax=Streptomyces sp. 21So2-11 TaxID=3144408 RepID=UPI003218E272